METFDLNYLSVLVAAIIQFILGAFWYSPVLFGKKWMKLSGLTMESIDQSKKKGMWKYYFASFLSALVMAFVLAHVIFAFKVSSAYEAMVTAFWMWMGFIATVSLGSILWEGKSFHLYLINTGYYLVALILMSEVIFLW